MLLLASGHWAKRILSFLIIAFGSLNHYHHQYQQLPPSTRSSFSSILALAESIEEIEIDVYNNQKGWAVHLADTVGSWLSSTLMGQTEGKPFGPEAKAVLSKSTSYRERSASSTTTPSTPTTNGGDKANLATFAAGCFWGLELSFMRVPGVISTRVGYTGGTKSNPAYEEVCRGTTEHAEAVEITFNPEIVSYPELLTVLWDRHDPTQKDGQGNDIGTQYRSAIFYHSNEQRDLAKAAIAEEQKKRSAPIVTEVVPASKFWPAEDYHQRYLEKGGQCARKGTTSAIKCYG